MIIVQLQGGLGNQMFQYAIGRNLSVKWKSPLLFDDSFFQQSEFGTITPRKLELSIFDIKLSFASPELIAEYAFPSRINELREKIGFAYKKVVSESSLVYSPLPEKLHPPYYLKGFWQSERYFHLNQALIRADFNLKDRIDSNTRLLASQIESQNAVSIHVRRSDFTTPKNMSFHGTCSIDYYRRAIATIENEIDNPVFYIFSDDFEWVTLNLLPLLKDANLVDFNTGIHSWKDMYLMSVCKHNIIANSSFSWWGAWLNSNPTKKVLAPQSWFASRDSYRDDSTIVPDSWIKVRND